MSDTEKNGFAGACDFIDDGYSREGVIVAEDGVHGPLTFSYRPALPEQVSKLLDPLNKENDELYTKVAIDLLPGLLLGWNLKDRKGEVVKISRENVARVNRKLLVKVIDRVFFELPVEIAVKN